MEQNLAQEKDEEKSNENSNVVGGVQRKPKVKDTTNGGGTDINSIDNK